MLEAADAAYLIYDPDEVEDAMHAALFRGPNIFKHRYRRGRSGAIDGDLRTMGLISRICDEAAAGSLSPVALARKMRARRKHMPYLRAFLARVIAEDRPFLTALLCRAVLADRPIPRFRHHLEAAEARLAARQADTDASTG